MAIKKFSSIEAIQAGFNLNRNKGNTFISIAPFKDPLISIKIRAIL
jgi:hypothetical protein